jgi:hypothetical protein
MTTSSSATSVPFIPTLAVTSASAVRRPGSEGENPLRELGLELEDAA